MKHFLVILFTLVLNFTFAQPRVVTFGSEESKIVETNNLKLHFLEMIYSDFSIYYERKIIENLTVEVGVGFTYGDFIGNFFTPTLEITDNIGLDRSIGYSFSGGVRLYPVEAFDGFYIAPEYKHRLYNWENEVTIYEEITSNNFEAKETFTVQESRVHSMLRLSFGYVTTTFNNFTWDFFGGIGINKRTENIFTQNAQKVEVIHLKAVPRVNIGIKVGYLF